MYATDAIEIDPHEQPTTKEAVMGVTITVMWILLATLTLFACGGAAALVMIQPVPRANVYDASSPAPIDVGNLATSGMRP
jgi:hypothetical protein